MRRASSTALTAADGVRGIANVGRTNAFGLLGCRPLGRPCSPSLRFRSYSLICPGSPLQTTRSSLWRVLPPPQPPGLPLVTCRTVPIEPDGLKSISVLELFFWIAAHFSMNCE